MVNTEVKGTLAKLLATENLRVEHRKISTACFDVDKRVLILPIWKTASSTVYDLLVGHEVGHALYTPNEDFGDAPKDFVNVLEDARIERMMKRTYPGLRKSFFEGYNQLWDQDFFGVKDEDPEILPFIDRINLYFKGKPDMPFKEEEQDYVTRASQTKTWEEVIALAKEIFDFCKVKQEEKDFEMPKPNNKSGGDELSPGGEEMTHEEMLEEADKREQENAEADLETPSYSGLGGESFDETESITEQALREALEDLVDDNAKEWVYIDLPKIQLSEYVTPWREVRQSFDLMYTSGCWEDNEWLTFSHKKCEEYRKSAQKSVNYLVKQFEMKKSADQYARAAVSKTGVIDTNSLYKYKLTEDIFKKTTVIPDGKNHGMVMMLDWSGSMSTCLMDTLRQTYNLIWFCKKVNIPFRVYAFQSGYGRERIEGVNMEENTLCIHDDFKMFEFFSSQMNAKTLELQMRDVWAHAWSLCHYASYSSVPGMNLGGTPLAESVMCMREIVREMKAVEKVQKVNCVILSDGEANPISYTTTFPAGYYREGELRSEYLCHNRNKVFILRDPQTGYARKFDPSPWNTTKEIVSFYSEITNYNWIGIRICSKIEMNRIAEHNSLDSEALSKQWVKERYAETTKLGFTKQFFMPNNYTGGGTEDIQVKQKGEVATRAELSRAFKKHMGSKMTNKTILNAFIEQVA